MNLFLCVKYKNSGKLSSHNWFFNGFCKELRPKYAVLLDVGLRTEGTALLKMYRYMKDYDNIGGVCGYMSLKIEKVDESEEIKDEEVDFLTGIMNKFTDIQRTQQVEYHFAHLMDKPFEASFGFIHVLPGAFSAYNMSAILNYNADEDDVLLKSYFKSIDEKLANRKIIKSEMGVQISVLRVALPDMINRDCIEVDPESDEAMLYDENVYLAEDRILCMGIHKKGFGMAFLPDAYAEVDPMKSVHGLLGQRKRWINGSYFAFEKVKKELSEHEKSIGF
jgi:chitin synthase